MLLSAALTLGVGFGSLAQSAPAAASEPLALAAVVAAEDAPRAATVLAVPAPAATAPLPADLLAPLPADYTAPAHAARPTDGLQTTRWILGIATAVLGLVVAITQAR